MGIVQAQVGFYCFSRQDKAVFLKSGSWNSCCGGLAVCQKPGLRGKGSGSGSDNESVGIVCDTSNFVRKQGLGSCLSWNC